MMDGFKRPCRQPFLRFWGRRGDLAVRRKLMVLVRKKGGDDKEVWRKLNDPCTRALQWIRKAESTWGPEAQRLSARWGKAFGVEFLQCAKDWQQARLDSQFDEKTTRGDDLGCSALRSQAHLELIRVEDNVRHPWALFLIWWMKKYGRGKHAAHLNEIERMLFTQAQTIHVPGCYSIQFKHEELEPNDRPFVAVTTPSASCAKLFFIYDDDNEAAISRLRAYVRSLEAQ